MKRREKERETKKREIYRQIDRERGMRVRRDRHKDKEKEKK